MTLVGTFATMAFAKAPVHVSVVFQPYGHSLLRAYLVEAVIESCRNASRCTTKTGIRDEL